MEKIKIRKNFDLCDFLQEQSFLEQMHRNGKRLIAKNGSSFIFEECDRDEFVYRMECINIKEKNETDIIAERADLGWELAEVKPQKSLFLIKTNYRWYYFCKKKSPVEAENEIMQASSGFKLCACISRRVNIEFLILILAAALFGSLNILTEYDGVFYDILYIILTIAILSFTGRYMQINLGMGAKIKQLLSVYED